MNCKDAIPLMHEYFDGDLTGPQSLELRKHLLTCPGCKERFRQLENTVALLKSSYDPMRAPDRLTSAIMESLPLMGKRSGWMQWIRRHPAVSVAAVFLLVFFNSFLTLWNKDTDMVVKGSDLSGVVIQGDTVYVPAGSTVNGNLLVENGKIRVDGEVKGNVVVIDGSVALASTAHIAGEITKVDQTVEWVWYKLNQWFSILSK